jgi:hypothetical protein
MHKNKKNKKNKRTEKKTKRIKKYSKKQQTGQPNREKQQKGKTMKNDICKKGMTDEAYKYYKYTEFFKNNNKSLDMNNKKSVSNVQ